MSIVVVVGIAELVEVVIRVALTVGVLGEL